MKKLSPIIIVLIFLFPVTALSQYSDFDLSRYKLPDIRLNRLDATVNLNNTSSNDEHSGSFSSNSKSNIFQGVLNLNYYYLRNTSKYQGLTTASVNLSANPYNFTSGNNKSEYTNNSATIQVTSTNRFFNSGNNFLEIIPSITSGLNSYSQKNTPGSKSDSKQFDHEISMPVSVGHGRIEPVEDLRLAIYILEELYKAGRIDNIPSDEVVLDMAKEISKIIRTRFFDTRIMKIRELQVIDSFIVANKIVNKNDISYFAILNDQWDYASGPSRFSGFSVNAGIDNNISLNGSRTDNLLVSPDASIDKNNIYFAGLFVALNYSKPVNLYWQSVIVFRTSYGDAFYVYPKDNTYVGYKDYSAGRFNSSLSYTIQYLPNSRTSVSLTVQGKYMNQKSTQSGTSEKDNYFTLYTGLNMYYYISPRLRLQITSSLSSSDDKTLTGVLTNKQTHLYLYNYLTLTYSFF